ncbi:MAG: peptide chain release factor-like protein [Terrimicrobiaceae bacterium]|nr:peptide chain release factor-like protein [Terrimicrobiaceae bacterium]
MTNLPGSVGERLQAAGIAPAEVREIFTRGSGPGGQNINKVETAVRLFHEPTGLAASASESRSREINRRMAWLRLAEAAERRRLCEIQSRKALAAKSRRQRARRSRAAKQELVRQKRHRARILAKRRHRNFED